MAQEKQLETLRIEQTVGGPDARQRFRHVSDEPPVAQVDTGRALALQDPVVHEVGWNVLRQAPVQDVGRRRRLREQPQGLSSMRRHIAAQIENLHSP